MTSEPEPQHGIRRLRLGTRGSQLALYQARTVAAQLQQKAGVTCDIVVIKTSGDRLAEARLAQIGGKRVFVKEIEDALLDGTIDLAVHSSKDMPALLPDGLDIGGVLPREDARDALVLPHRVGTVTLGQARAQLGTAPRIGTSSVRRSAQLSGVFPGASFLPIRGNLDTRLRKLDSGEFDAIVLAAAGLRRLEQTERISVALPAAVCVPAPGQGIICIEMRRGDERLRGDIDTINDVSSRRALDAERAVVARLGGGCQMPIGAYAEVAGDQLAVTALVATLDGSRMLRSERRGRSDDALTIGVAAADDLLAQGAHEILADVDQSHAAVEGLQP